MNILVIGDVYGKPGRDTLKKLLPSFVKKYQVEFVICNVENLAHGKGITESTLNDLLSLGIDCFTGGNHIFKKDGLNICREGKYPITRPANYPIGTVGDGFKLFEKNGKKILVINLMGRVFMPGSLDCPFRKVEEILKSFAKKKVDYVFVDFHAEATSEKIAMKYFLNGKVSFLYGTHTHVTTADLQITPEKTAYITDIGMTGNFSNSVIGVESSLIIDKFITQMDSPHRVSSGGKNLFSGVLLKMEKRKYPREAQLIYEMIDSDES